MRIRGKSWTFSVMLLILSMVFLSACSSKSTKTGETSTPSNQTGTTPAPAKPAPPQLLTVATRTPLGPFDPIKSTTSTNGWFLFNVIENLVWSDGMGNYSPRLATEWKRDSDTVWTFKLRQGVTFHDGTPFNAAAAKFSLERVAGNDSVHKGDFTWMDKVEAVDEHTLRIHTKGVYPPLLSRMAFYYPFIVSPEAVKKYGDDFSNNPVGTGPFKFEKHVQNSETNIVRNDAYWGEKSKLERVRIRQVTEESSRLSGMLTGELHGSLVVEPSMKKRLDQENKFQVIQGPGVLVDRLALNVKHKPYDDVRVRRALAHAIDRQGLMEGVFEGFGVLYESPLAPTMWGSDPELNKIRYEYNPTKAKQLLAEAGVAPGTEIQLWAASRPDHRQIVEVLQQNFEAVGLKLKVTLMDAAVLSTEVRKGIHPSFIFGSYAIGDPDRVLVEWETRTIPSSNRFNYSNPQVDQMIAAQRTELDPNKRKQIIIDASKIMVEESANIIFRARVEVQAFQPNIKGWKYHPEAWVFWDVSIE